MLNIVGRLDRASRFCDGLARREFLKIGGLLMGGLSLPDLLRAEAASGISRSHKGVIMIFLPGGPPHQDMFDLKMDAPSEIRGEFKPIATNVAGIQICELFPRMAAMSDKLIYIRSIVGATGHHYAVQCMTGRSHVNPPQGGWPSLGSTVSYLHGPTAPSVPPFVSLCYNTAHAPWGDPGQPGFLGVPHAAFRPMADGKQDMVLQGISLERLQDRRTLLTAFDSFRRQADASGMMEGMDAFQQQAFGVLTSSKLVDALDLSKEDPRLVERYGKGIPKPRDDGAPRMVENFLIARRLIEAGARVVTVNFSRWDWHGANFKQAREDFPMLDQALTALVEDLYARGMDKDVSVVVWGEFGRTPQINADAGRDHWPQVSCALLACGGMHAGQVIGATNRLGEYATERPVQFGEVLATIYHQMGIDVSHATVPDLNGRPRYLVDDGIVPMPELV